MQSGRSAPSKINLTGDLDFALDSCESSPRPIPKPLTRLQSDATKPPRATPSSALALSPRCGRKVAARTPAPIARLSSYKRLGVTSVLPVQRGVGRLPPSNCPRGPICGRPPLTRRWKQIFRSDRWRPYVRSVDAAVRYGRCQDGFCDASPKQGDDLSEATGSRGMSRI
jgi:hypothetical protein